MALSHYYSGGVAVETNRVRASSKAVLRKVGKFSY